MRKSSLEKYRAIQKRYKDLYHGERKRIDDVHRQLAKEFFCSVRWVEEVLRMELPEQDKPH